MTELVAAVDLVGGDAVRLVQGDFGRLRAHGDPLALAGRYCAGGARWLHVVDLDAARTGRPVNRPVVLALAQLAHGAGARVEVGGGVRDGADVDALVAAGVDRVVVGTVALEQPDRVAGWARRHPGRVAVGIDYRRGDDDVLTPAVRGWTRPAAPGIGEAVARFEGEPLAAVVVTAIDRDGTGLGPDLEGLAGVLDATSLPVVASGGVRTLAHLEAVARLRSPAAGRRPWGVVVGTALADGTLDVGEAVGACAASV